MRAAQAMTAVKSSEFATAFSLGWTGVKFKALVVTRTIARQFRPFQFRLKFFDDLTLQAIAKLLGYWMSDIGIEPGPALRIDGQPQLWQANPAMIAKPCLQMIFCLAAGAMSRHFATRHRHKQTRLTFDDSQVADHETFSKRDAAKSTQAIFGVADQLDPNFGNVHFPLPPAWKPTTGDTNFWLAQSPILMPTNPGLFFVANARLGTPSQFLRAKPRQIDFVQKSTITQPFGSNSLTITRQSGNAACNFAALRRATSLFGNIPK
jgi:hypothetical protein